MYGPKRPSHSLPQTPPHEFCILFAKTPISSRKANKIHWTLGQRSAINQKIPFTKFTISKSHCSQNSQFQSPIFHKIHIFKVSFFTKFTFFKHQILGNFWIKSWSLPQCVVHRIYIILGTWPPAGHVFQIPRYVMCLQSNTNPEGYKDVVVTDETSITHFDSDGYIKGELRQSYVERFRGLDFHYGYNQFVTTEKNRLGIKVVFFSLETGIEKWDWIYDFYFLTLKFTLFCTENWTS